MNNSYWCVIWKHAKILAMFLLENGITGIFHSFFVFLFNYLNHDTECALLLSGVCIAGDLLPSAAQKEYALEILVEFRTF